MTRIPYGLEACLEKWWNGHYSEQLGGVEYLTIRLDFFLPQIGWGKDLLVGHLGGLAAILKIMKFTGTRKQSLQMNHGDGRYKNNNKPS